MFSVRNNLSYKITGILLLFFVVAIVAIGTTLHLSWQLEGAAAAINDSGSERMRSYRISYLLLRAANGDAKRHRDVEAELAAFEDVLQNLERGDPARPLFVPPEAAIRADVSRLREQWNEHMKPLVEKILDQPPGPRREALQNDLDAAIGDFVGIINGLVLKMEHSYADKATLLRTSQILLVVLALIGTGILIRIFGVLVVRPVASLKEGLQRMSADDLAVRLPVRSRDEFGELAEGFNTMASHLQNVYATLEQRVEAKTSSLAEKNRELALLYSITAFLSEPSSLDSLCRGFLARVQDALGAVGGTVRLYDPRTRKLTIMVHDGLSEDFVRAERELGCGDCLCGTAVDINVSQVVDLRAAPQGMTLENCRRSGFASAGVFTISYNKRALGIFNLYFREPRAFSDSERRHLETLCQHLGVTLENHLLRLKEKQMAINEERNLLAQELHDSIAQGLAFLNLQAQMLDDSLRSGKIDEAKDVTRMIREGAQESYEDVRELLVHFRTRVTHTDLDSAIRQSLKRLETQTGISTRYEPRCANLPLTPDGAVQALHIVQEVLSNVRKHAQASEVRVLVERRADDFVIVIADNGKGFAADQDVGADHIGLKIIQERAQRMGGICRIYSKMGSGTTVEVLMPTARVEAA